MKPLTDEEQELIDSLSTTSPLSVVEGGRDPTRPLSSTEIAYLRRMMLFWIKWRIAGGIVVATLITLGAIMAYTGEALNFLRGLGGK